MASEVIRALHLRDELDPSRRTQRVAGRVLVPVRRVPEFAFLRTWGADVVEDEVPVPRTMRITPHESVLEQLAGLSAAQRALVPDKWEQHGDVLVLRLPEALRPSAEVVARAFADAMGLRTVIDDREGVRGELREMEGRLLLGDDPEAVHVENGIRYRFDASRIMFSSGNLAERMRAAAFPARGETVVDMFAGIGYFALPLAVHAGAARIHALEKNPRSFAYLKQNVVENGVADIVVPWLGDNREFVEEGIADRVHMGYFPGTQAFLPKALRLLKPEGGILHYHNTAHAEGWAEEMTAQVFDAAMDAHLAAEVLTARIVKTHSPGVVHAVLDVRIAPAP